jgi:hypothetical protein
MVCIDDLDVLDPWRLPARETEDINLPFVRPDYPLTDPQAIQAPTLFGVATLSSVTLTWSDISVINQWLITGYKLYRSVNGGAFTLLTITLPGATRQYVDSGISSGNTYAYYVTAIAGIEGSPDQVSPPSNRVSFTISVPAVNAQLTQLAQGQGGYLASGFFPVTGPSVAAVRFNVTFNSIAAPPDTTIPGFGSVSIDNCFHVPGRFIALDSGDIADSSDGATWTLGSGLNSNIIDSSYALVYDDLHSVIVAAISVTGGDIAIAPNASPVTFTQHLGVVAESMGCLGYKGPGTGIILGICGPGGGSAGQVFKSTNGGTTWTHVSTLNFGSSNAGYFVGFGVSHWLAIGDDGTFSKYALSTDDGATWSAPADFPNSGGSTVTVRAIATDGAGNWVVISNGTPPDNYWVSNNDGVTWTSPNLFSAQGGMQNGSLLWNGSQWLGAWSDPTQAFNILASSADGRTWTVGPTVTEV